MIGIADCNNFYCSAERVFDPNLVGVPLGVLSNNDGVVIARSNELKALGVPMGAPAYQLRDQVRRGEIVLKSSNYELYGDLSQRVQTILADHSAGIEPYSIDECFLRLDGFSLETLERHCVELKGVVGRWTGIPISIGAAPSRTLAKLANRLAKKVPAFEGVCVLEKGSQALRQALELTDLDDVWGVGRRQRDKLHRINVYNAYDLTQVDLKTIQRQFGVVMERTVLELRGIRAIEMNDADEPKQRIMTSRSFGQSTSDRSEVAAALVKHGQRGAEKLRQQQSTARAVMVFIQTDRFRQGLPQYAQSTVIGLDRPSNDSRTILAAVKTGLNSIWRDGYRYKKAGVMMLDLRDTSRAQMSLLDEPEDTTQDERSQRLMTTLDDLNQKMGRGTVHFGLASRNAPWELKAVDRSPRWTTRWNELPIARA